MTSTQPSPHSGARTVATGPLTRDAGTYLAFIRGPEGIMVELIQQPRDTRNPPSHHTIRETNFPLPSTPLAIAANFVLFQRKTPGEPRDVLPHPTRPRCRRPPPRSPRRAPAPPRSSEINIDWATYNPVSHGAEGAEAAGKGIRQGRHRHPLGAVAGLQQGAGIPQRRLDRFRLDRRRRRADRQGQRQPDPDRSTSIRSRNGPPWSPRRKARSRPSPT